MQNYFHSFAFSSTLSCPCQDILLHHTAEQQCTISAIVFRETLILLNRISIGIYMNRTYRKPPTTSSQSTPSTTKSYRIIGRVQKGIKMKEEEWRKNEIIIYEYIKKWQKFGFPFREFIYGAFWLEWYSWRALLIIGCRIIFLKYPYFCDSPGTLAWKSLQPHS